MSKSLESRALILLTGLNVLDYLDRYLIASLATPVKLELGLSDKAFGFLGTAFFLVYFLSSPIFGHLGDRWGRTRLMAGGAALWSLATSLTYWVASYPALLLARGLVGIGEASFGTLAPAYFADILPFSRRPRSLGIFYMAIPVGTALAFLIGGLVSGRWGWRPAFLLAGLPGLALAFFISGLNRDRERFPAPAAQAPPEGKLAANLSLWRIPSFRRVTLGYGMITFAMGGLAFWMSRYLEVVKGLSHAQASYLLFGAIGGAGALGTLAGGLLGSSLARRTKVAPLWISGLGVALALPLAGLTIFAPQPALYIPGLVGAVFLLFLNPGILTAVVVSVAGPARRARAVALNIVIIHLVGDVPAPFLMGWVSDVWGLKWAAAVTLPALVAAVGLILGALPYLEADLRQAGEADK